MLNFPTWSAIKLISLLIKNCGRDELIFREKKIILQLIK